MIAAGDKVTWMVTSSTGDGSSFGFHTRAGTVVRVEPDGYAIVKGANNQNVLMPIGRLRKDGEKTQVTEVTEFFAGKQLTEPSSTQEEAKR